MAANSTGQPSPPGPPVGVDVASPTPQGDPGLVSEVVHRRLGQDDAGEVLTVQRAAFLAEARLYRTTEIPPLTESLEDVRREISSTHSLGAFHGPRLVGSLRLTVDGEVGWISRVAVAPDFQGRGIGSALLMALESDAPPLVREFRLAAGSKSQANRAMYERRGYRELTRAVDSVGIELIVMSKLRTSWR